MAITVGTTSLGADSLIHEFSQLRNTSMVKEVGWIIATMKVASQLTGETEVTEREAQVVLGCLNKNWKLSQSAENEDIKKSCERADYKSQKSKGWTWGIDTRTVSPVAIAALYGMELQAPTVASDGLLLEHTEDVVVPITTFDPALSNVPELVISVEKIANGATTTSTVPVGTQYHETATPVADTPEYSIDTQTLTFEANEVSASFRVIYLHYSVSDAEGIVLADNPNRSPSVLTLILSYLNVDEFAETEGRIIVRATECVRDGGLDFGGVGAQENEGLTLGGKVNGDVKIHFEYFG